MAFPLDPSTLGNSIFNSMQGMTRSEEGIKRLFQNPDIVLHFLTVARRSVIEPECESAHNCLVNISASIEGRAGLYSTMPNIGRWLIVSIPDFEIPYSFMKCQILSNLTLCELFCTNIINFLHASPSITFNKLLYLLNLNEPEVKCNYHQLAMVFGNLSACAEGKNLFLDDNHPCVKYLLPFTTYGESESRRLGIGMLLKNICCVIDKHKWLLEDIDILPALLLPLAGPEKYPDNEREKLPLELRYLADDQIREPVESIRQLLLDALVKLCTTRFGRATLRDKGVCYILRNLYRCENSASVIFRINIVVEILNRDEDDIGADIIATQAIPQDVINNFQGMVITSSYYC